MAKYVYEEITLDLNTSPALQAVRSVQDAIDGLADTLKKLRQTWGDLGATASQSAQQAAKRMSSAAQSSAKAVHALAGFDQLERIDGATAKESTQVSVDMGQISTAPLAQELEKLQTLLKPVLNVDLAPLQQSLQTAATAFSGFAALADNAVRGLLNGVLMPACAWIMEVMTPQLLKTLTTAISAVTGFLTPLRAEIQSLFLQLQQMISYIKASVLAVLQNIGQVLNAALAMIGPILVSIGQLWQSVFGQMSSVLGQFVTNVTNGLRAVAAFMSGVFMGEWERIWSALGLIGKAGVNLMIGLINTLLDGAVQGINRIVAAINKLKITAPGWIPQIGGETVSFSLNTVSAPKVPYLAQGAVLPANRPFLAMVGDQRHGTNIEAPLATIQEAVANVMRSQTGAMMAGFEASVQVQQQILEAVLGIRVGDDVIANACDRYHRKMAVMRGG